MENKSAVSALQEFCAKSRRGFPKYDYIIGQEGGYTCKVTALEMESSGYGLNKREAKKLAAQNILRKIREEPGVSMQQNLKQDKLMEGLCVRHGKSVPPVEVVQQAVDCTVGGISKTKKKACQRADSKVLPVLSNQMQLVNEKPADASVKMKKTIAPKNVEHMNIFSTYKQINGPVSVKSVPICDRHNYFKRFLPALKEAAFEVIRSDKYVSAKDKAMDILSALKITPSINTLASTSEEPLLQLDLNCEFDCLFLEFQSDIYVKVIEYFKIMLL